MFHQCRHCIATMTTNSKLQSKNTRIFCSCLSLALTIVLNSSVFALIKVHKISLVFRFGIVFQFFQFSRVPEHEDNHCEGRVNLPDTLSQLQGNNSVVGWQQLSCWRCDTVAIPSMMPLSIINNMSESLSNSSSTVVIFNAAPKTRPGAL